jgi:small subunit ribosomal protein S1
MAGADRERRRDLFERLRVGDVVDGTVAGMAGYGAFVQIGDAPDEHLFGDGLIHVSELASGRVTRMADVVRLGQRVRARVIELEPEQNRIRLSLRDVPPA